jgi:hypothetical protein
VVIERGRERRRRHAAGLEALARAREAGRSRPACSSDSRAKRRRWRPPRWTRAAVRARRAGRRGPPRVEPRRQRRRAWADRWLDRSRWSAALDGRAS